MFKTANSSPIYQLKKYYPDIYSVLLSKEIHECKKIFKQNIEKGIQQELYRKDFTVEENPQYVNLENNKTTVNLTSVVLNWPLSF